MAGYSFVAILAMGQAFPILMRGIELSIGAIVGMVVFDLSLLFHFGRAGLALGGLVSFYALDAGLPLPLVILSGLLAGVAVGLLNGALVALPDLPPIIVTLAMLSVVRGTALGIGGPEQHLIRGEPAYSFIGAGSLFGLPFSIYIFAAVAVAMILLQFRTPLGLLVAATGENERAAAAPWREPSSACSFSA